MDRRTPTNTDACAPPIGYLPLCICFLQIAHPILSSSLLLGPCFAAMHIQTRVVPTRIVHNVSGSIAAAADSARCAFGAWFFEVGLIKQHCSASANHNFACYDYHHPFAPSSPLSSLPSFFILLPYFIHCFYSS